MAKRCYYEVLEVERKANDGELKTAFRKLAMKWHPDRNPGDKDCEHRFKEINEAYEILKDPDKRAAYDRFGHAAFEQNGGGGGGFSADWRSASRKPIAARPPRCGCRRRSPANPAPAPAPRPARSRRPARIATAPDASAMRKASSRWNGPARVARGAAR